MLSYVQILLLIDAYSLASGRHLPFRGCRGFSVPSDSTTLNKRSFFLILSRIHHDTSFVKYGIYLYMQNAKLKGSVTFQPLTNTQVSGLVSYTTCRAICKRRFLMSRPWTVNLAPLRLQRSEMPETLARNELSSKVCFSSCPKFVYDTTPETVRHH